MVMQFLQWISIFLELVIAVLGIIMIYRKNIKGWFFLITFGIYVIYDFIRLNNALVNLDILYLSFFIATLSALFLAWMVYRKR